jgi:hypothetical protein
MLYAPCVKMTGGEKEGSEKSFVLSWFEFLYISLHVNVIEGCKLKVNRKNKAIASIVIQKSFS